MHLINRIKRERAIEIIDKKSREYIKENSNSGDEKYGCLRALIDEIENKS